MKPGNEIARRGFLVSTAALAFAGAPLRPARAAAKMKIGIVGAGHIGGELGQMLAEAGYPVMLSARDLAPVQTLVATIGHGARAGTVKDAILFGDVVVMAVPWGALPQVGRDYGAALKGKIVIDTCNPRAERDGDIAKAGLKQGTGVTDPEFLSGTRLVRAYNALNYRLLASSPHHAGALIAIPLAADDKPAMDIVAQIVRDTGFEPVIVGGLSTAKSFDQGTPDYGTALTAAELRKQLNIP